MFPGAYTAIVTPFHADGSVDFGKLKALIERQMASGVDGIVPVGTTGESPTLNYDEHKQVVKVSVETCRGRVKVIAGTGANSTAEALELTRFAVDVGADGTLQVSPYYNKPNQEGLIRHFSTIADLGLPVVLYNVPGRTGVEIAVDTVVKLAQHPRIVALKEASGNLNRVSQILTQCEAPRGKPGGNLLRQSKASGCEGRVFAEPSEAKDAIPPCGKPQGFLAKEGDFCILSGDDSLTLPIMAVGGKGVISVAANVAPKAVADMVHFALKGDWAKAMNLHRKYFRLFTDLFLDTNPIPVKAALAMMGQIEEIYRLPLCPTNKAVKDKLAKCLKVINLI